MRGCVFTPPKHSVIKEIFIMAQRAIRSATSSEEQQVQIKKKIVFIWPAAKQEGVVVVRNNLVIL